jgi:hypothetical protein
MMRAPLIGVALATVASLSILSISGAGLQAQADRQNVVLITLDGARTEEVFGGLDLDVLKSTLREKQKPEDQALYKRFWADTPQARREKLMPWFWTTFVREHGSIAGNRAIGSIGRLTNTHRFSYPGYSEILTGEAHDEVIKSNDAIRNPYTTVLEGLRAHLKLPASGVATFGSWDVFNAIAEHVEGATFVNAGFEAYDSPDAAVRQMSALQTLATTPWDSVRHDYYTHRFAMEYLARVRPRVLYLAYGETDDWAHDGRYDRVLDSYTRFDRDLKELWTWLQSQEEYRGRTHLLITTDHGRGPTAAEWRDHGAKVEGAQYVWFAFASPKMSRRGEWRDHAPVTTNQVAPTLAKWAGLDWKAQHPNVGAPIE